MSLRTTVADSVAALRVITDSVVLRANTVFSLLAQLSTPVINGLLPVLVIRRFAGGDPETGAALFGASEAAIAAGAVAGSVVLARAASRGWSRRKGQLVIWGFVAAGASMIAVALAPSFPALLVVLLVIGVANVIFFVPNMSIMQELAPANVRGGVIGARISMLHLSWLPVGFAAGALADVVDAALLIGIAGAFTLVVSLIASRIPVVADVP